MLLGLSTGNKIGLGVVALLFIAFALASALLIPRYRPDFPGRAGVRLFVLATLLFFVAMMGAVHLFGAEEEHGATAEAAAHADEGSAATGEGGEESADQTEPTTTEAGQGAQEGDAPAGGTQGGESGRTIKVAGTEFEFDLPEEDFSPGSYTFVLENIGNAPHNLVVQGPGVDDKATPVIDPGKTAPVKVKLSSGTYKIYCSVPGHEDAGMTTEVEVSQ